MAKQEIYKQILQKSNNNISRAEFWVSREGKDDIESLIFANVSKEIDELSQDEEMDVSHSESVEMRARLEQSFIDISGSSDEEMFS